MFSYRALFFALLLSTGDMRPTDGYANNGKFYTLFCVFEFQERLKSDLLGNHKFNYAG